jgi:hypothetical protein
MKAVKLAFFSGYIGITDFFSRYVGNHTFCGVERNCRKQKESNLTGENGRMLVSILLA